MKKEVVEKKKVAKSLVLLYGLVGVVVLVLIAVMIAWLNNPFPVRLQFTY